MTGICICPDCSNPVRMYEADGISKGKCICGRTLTQSYAHRDQAFEKESPATIIKAVDFWYYGHVQKGKAVLNVGAYETLLEAERACTDRAKKGERCFVDREHQIVSEWVDGERKDLQRKFIKIRFSYTTHTGEVADGSSTVITTQDGPTFKAIEYYLLKNTITLKGYVVTDDDGRILEESEANTSTPGSSCTEAVE